MLKSLTINNIAVIEQTSIELENGFNVLTGETGSGKSIIIDSLGAVLGSRTSKELVRTGADTARVIAEFTDIANTVKDKLREMDLYDGEDTLIIQRSISHDGRSSCRINGKPVTAGATKQIAGMLVNIHGQRDNAELLKPENHRKYIDLLMNDDKLIADYKASYKKLCETIRALREIDTDDSEKEKLILKLTSQIKELEQAQIVPGEREKLLKRREILNNSAQVISALNKSIFSVCGDDETDGAVIAVDTAQKLLSQFSDVEGIGDICSELSECSFKLSAAADRMREETERFDISPQEIDAVEDRLAELYNILSKYGGSEEEALDYLEQCKSRLENIQFAEERRNMLEEQFEQRRETAYNLALKLSEKRVLTARKLEKDIQSELEFLNMSGAVFSVSRSDGPMCSTGIDNIEFMISLNKGETLKPLVNVASGGELSRIMLAIKSVLGEKDSVGTLIFDEIDAGVSGRAAEKIGIKLKSISASAQVICVTHLAQIACLADNHYLIDKSVKGERTYTQVKPLDIQGRVNELARIMGGTNITDEMLESARQMLTLSANTFKEKYDENL